MFYVGYLNEEEFKSIKRNQLRKPLGEFYGKVFRFETPGHFRWIMLKELYNREYGIGHSLMKKVIEQ